MTLRRLAGIYRDRLLAVGCMLAAALVIGFVLRCVLYISFHDGGFSVGQFLLALAFGFVVDVLVSLVVLGPQLFLMAVTEFRFWRRPTVRAASFAGMLATLLFLACAEYFFFDEFNARFNHIALDYLIYPHEVFVNIWESYNVPLFIGVALAAGGLLSWPMLRAMRGATFGRLPWGARWRAGILSLAVSVGALLVLTQLPAMVCENRITAEVAQNGLAQLVRAFMTADLDYPLYYRTLPTAEAHARAAQVLGVPAPSEGFASSPAFELQRTLVPAEATAATPKPWDVVVILEESFGSEFVGVLGHPERKTSPQFDRWSKEGVLLTHLVANGNRTVRGLEGVLCSFLPLPGDSLVKRTHSPHVASLAEVFRNSGYRTSFFYGGIGLFDHMKPFALANGYEQFVEQGDYPSGAFRTIWGVADEYIFDAMLKRQVEAHAKGERLFATLLSVSNHKPYDVPPGRTGRPANERSRNGAVAYADWAIGDYLDKAKKAGLLDHTLVLIVGDHGARVYGSQQIPTPSYRIPALFLTPDASKAGTRIDRLCSQIDLAPTLLSMAGIRCEAPFFGQDLTSLPADGGRAFVHHNRDVGILTDRCLVALGLQKTVAYYRRSGKGSDEFERVEEKDADEELKSLERDATAVFQTAYDLYKQRRFQLPVAPASAAPATSPVTGTAP